MHINHTLCLFPPFCFFLVILEHQMEILHLGNCVQNSKHITRNIWKSLADYSLPVLDHICYEENLLICIMAQFSQIFFFFFFFKPPVTLIF